MYLSTMSSYLRCKTARQRGVNYFKCARSSFKKDMPKQQGGGEEQRERKLLKEQ
jgi:hypothetical protein